MDTNTMVNHWGKWVDKTEPVTGVISFNDVCQFVCDEICCNGIDLQYEEACKEFESEFLTAHDREPDEDEWDQFYNELDGMESGDNLIGDWRKDDTGLYEPDSEGNNGYSAIVRESTVQVVWSKYVTTCKNLCSPCYPGQADVQSGEDEEGEFLAYNLPPEAYTY